MVGSGAGQDALLCQIS